MMSAAAAPVVKTAACVTADPALTARAVALLAGVEGARSGAVRARWNPRLRSTAGRAFARANVIELNPRLVAHPGEVERTLRHELAHLLVAWRTAAAATRRRHWPDPHGPEWRRACADLGIADETRCHRLELAPRRRVARRHVYRCGGCGVEWRRARPIPRRRPLACRACCRAHAGGRFDRRFVFVTAGGSPV